jgi:hypothetical protein
MSNSWSLGTSAGVSQVSICFCQQAPEHLTSSSVTKDTFHFASTNQQILHIWTHETERSQSFNLRNCLQMSEEPSRTHTFAETILCELHEQNLALFCLLPFWQVSFSSSVGIAIDNGQPRGWSSRLGRVKNFHFYVLSRPGLGPQ